MTTVTLHNVQVVAAEPIRQHESGTCSRTIAVYTRPLGATANVVDEVILFADKTDNLWLDPRFEAQPPVQIVQAKLEGVPDRIRELERDLNAARGWVEIYGRALAKVANAGLGRGALSEAIKVAEDALGDDLDFYASLNGEATA